MSPGSAGAGHGSARAVDLGGQAVEGLRAEQVFGRDRHIPGIGDMGVAHQEGAFGRLDRAVHVIEAVGLRDTQPVEQPQQDQRDDALGGRRHVERGSAGERKVERRAGLGLLPSQIGGAHRAFGSRQIGRDGPCELAAIEVVQARLGEPRQGLCQGRLFEDAARLGHLAVAQEGFGPAVNVGQFRPAARHAVVLRLAHREAVAGVVDGGFKQPRERQARAPTLRMIECRLPAGHRGRDGIGRQGPARRDGVEAAAVVKLGLDAGARRPDGRDRQWRGAARFVDQPEAVTAEPVHVGIDHPDGRRGRHHGLDRVAAVAQHLETGLGGQMVRCDDHSASGLLRIKHGDSVRIL